MGSDLVQILRTPVAADCCKIAYRAASSQYFATACGKITAIDLIKVVPQPVAQLAARY
jgi:hypothetical protein